MREVLDPKVKGDSTLVLTLTPEEIALDEKYGPFCEVHDALSKFGIDDAIRKALGDSKDAISEPVLELIPASGVSGTGPAIVLRFNHETRGEGEVKIGVSKAVMVEKTAENNIKISRLSASSRPRNWTEMSSSEKNEYLATHKVEPGRWITVTNDPVGAYDQVNPLDALAHWISSAMKSSESYFDNRDAKSHHPPDKGAAVFSYSQDEKGKFYLDFNSPYNK